MTVLHQKRYPQISLTLLPYQSDAILPPCCHIRATPLPLLSLHINNLIVAAAASASKLLTAVCRFQKQGFSSRLSCDSISVCCFCQEGTAGTSPPETVAAKPPLHRHDAAEGTFAADGKSSASPSAVICCHHTTLLMQLPHVLIVICHLSFVANCCHRIIVVYFANCSYLYWAAAICRGKCSVSTERPYVASTGTSSLRLPHKKHPSPLLLSLFLQFYEDAVPGLLGLMFLDRN